MRTITAQQHRAAPSGDAWLWEETGIGHLRRVTGIRADWWIVTGMCSWCCCPDTPLYQFSSTEQRIELETYLRSRLAARRERV